MALRHGGFVFTKLPLAELSNQSALQTTMIYNAPLLDCTPWVRFYKIGGVGWAKARLTVLTRAHIGARAEPTI
jgi:hypothetical protein